MIENTTAAALALATVPELAKLLTAASALETPQGDTTEITLRPDPTIGDGSWANHPWLRELPKPLTRVTWENVAALIGPATSRRRLGIDDRQHESMRETPWRCVRDHGVKRRDDRDSGVGAAGPSGRGRSRCIWATDTCGRKRCSNPENGRGVNVYPLQMHGGEWHTVGRRRAKRFGNEKLERGSL